MTSLFIGSVLLGTVFGRFFKVWILIPACALTFAIVAARSAYYQLGLLNVLLEFTVIAACLQIGYAHGCLSGVIPGRTRRLEIPRELSHPAAPRHRQPF
ncbi:MAG: hypothetical protein ACREDT_13470 [Methylocella sp.]